MNRINMIIDMYARKYAVSFLYSGVFAHDGDIEQAAEMTGRMMEARSQLKMWIKISQAIRGWQL